MQKRWWTALAALAASVSVHGLLAVAFMACLECAPLPEVSVALDLSSIEVSFAEEIDETAAVSEVASAPVQAASPKPKTERPAESKAVDCLPRKPADYRFPEPDERVRPVPSAQRAQAAPVARPAPRQAHVDAPPSPRRSIRPDYPRGSRQRGEQGDVVVEIHVTAEGLVDAVKVAVSSGYPELDAAAVKAVSAAKFSPARSGESAIDSVARLTLTFRLK